MSYIIRVFLKNKIWNLDLETFDQITIGSAIQDTVTVRELDESQVRITKTQDGEYLINGFFLSKIVEGVSSPVSEDILKEDNLYRVSGGETLEITVHPRQKNSKSIIDLSHFDRIQIGRNQMKNDIVLSNKRTSSVHCEFIKSEGSFMLRDLNSTNGTYLNNRLIEPYTEEKLYDGDVICFSIYRLYYIEKKLFFYNTGDDLQLNIRSLELSEGEKANEIFRVINRKEEPGLISGTVVLSDRPASIEMTEFEADEETQIGTEEEMERMLREARIQSSAPQETELSDDNEATVVGTEEQIEKMLEKEQ